MRPCFITINLLALTEKETLSAWTSLVAPFPAVQETWVPSLGQEDPLEEGTATNSSILAWRIPADRRVCGQQSVGSQRVRRASMHTWSASYLPGDFHALSVILFTFSRMFMENA